MSATVNISYVFDPIKFLISFICVIVIAGVIGYLEFSILDWWDRNQEFKKELEERELELKKWELENKEFLIDRKRRLFEERLKQPIRVTFNGYDYLEYTDHGWEFKTAELDEDQ